MNRRHSRLVFASVVLTAIGVLGARNLFDSDAFHTEPLPVALPSDHPSSSALARIWPSPTPVPWNGSVLAVAGPRSDGDGQVLDDGQGIALYEIGANAAPRSLVTGFDEIGGLSWSADGGTLAFAGRREGNWDIYGIGRDGAELARLTTHPAFDGWPTWSPDGREIAFVSYRDGNLDVYRMSVGSGVAGRSAAGDGAAGGDPPAAGAASDAGNSIVRITHGDDPAIEPAWSPDGRWIALAVWHEGAYRLEALALADLARHVVATPTAGSDLRAPAWSPDGRHLAYLDQRYGLGQVTLKSWQEGGTTIAGDPAGAGGKGEAAAAPAAAMALGAGEQTGAIGSATRPVASRALSFGWFPGGQALAVVAADRSERGIAIRGLTGMSHGQVAEWGGGQAQVAWSHGPLRAALPALAEDLRPERASTDPDTRPGLVRVDVAVSGDRIHADLAEDFAALRAEVRAAVGRDFLGRLSDLWRPLSFHSPGSAFFSWHKTGRAFDTQMELRGPGGRRDMVLVRDEQGGRTMWRMFLRAEAQDGSVGRPLTEPGWTFAVGSGDPDLTAEGGRRAGAVPGGYWVDFTAMAEAQGWRRIPSLTQSRLDWHRDWEAIEYWHYERRDGLRWFDAARQVYSDSELATQLHPDRLGALNIPFQRLARLGFPPIWPPES